MSQNPDPLPILPILLKIFFAIIGTVLVVLFIDYGLGPAFPGNCTYTYDLSTCFWGTPYQRHEGVSVYNTVPEDKCMPANTVCQPEHLHGGKPLEKDECEETIYDENVELQTVRLECDIPLNEDGSYQSVFGTRNDEGQARGQGGRSTIDWNKENPGKCDCNTYDYTIYDLGLFKSKNMGIDDACITNDGREDTGRCEGDTTAGGEKSYTKVDCESHKDCGDDNNEQCVWIPKCSGIEINDCEKRRDCIKDKIYPKNCHEFCENRGDYNNLDSIEEHWNGGFFHPTLWKNIFMFLSFIFLSCLICKNIRGDNWGKKNEGLIEMMLVLSIAYIFRVIYIIATRRLWDTFSVNTVIFIFALVIMFIMVVLLWRRAAAPAPAPASTENPLR